MAVKLMNYSQFINFASSYMDDDFNILGFVKELYTAGFIKRDDVHTYSSYAIRAMQESGYDCYESDLQSCFLNYLESFNNSLKDTNKHHDTYGGDSI